MKNSAILILALILIACRERSHDNTHNTPEEKRQNAAVDSTIEKNKTIDSSNNQIGFDIGYISKGKLFFYNSNSRTKREFKESSDIFNCVFDKASSTLYYTIIDSNDSLSLKMAFIDGEKTTTSFIGKFHLNPSDCQIMYYGEKSKLKFNSKSNLIFLENNFLWMIGFTDIATYDLNRKIFKNYKGESPENQISKKEQSELNFASKLMYACVDTRKMPSKIYAQLFEKKVDGVLELFLAKKTDTTQLSHTSELEYEMEDSFDKEFSYYDLSPDSSKLLFSVITSFGDLAHGPSYIVNINGKDQRKLETDCANSNRPIWFGENNLIYLVTEYYAVNKNDLNLFNSEQNLIQKISEDVDYYFVVK